MIDPSYASYVMFCGRLGQTAQEYEQWAHIQHHLFTVESDPQDDGSESEGDDD